MSSRLAAACVGICLSTATATGQIHEQTLSPGQLGESAFGRAVVLRGDTLAVGVPGDDGLEDDVGAVHVFEHDGAAWALAQEVPLPADASFAAWGGSSLAMDGDRMVVGAYATSDVNWTHPGSHRGEVHLYERSGGVWLPTQRIQPAEAAEGDEFGLAVALRGDVLVASSPHADAQGQRSGEVRVYRRDGGGSFELESLLRPVSGGPEQRFGAALALGDGELFIGAPGGDGPTAGSGVVHRYLDVAGTWTAAGTLAPPDLATRDRFGTALDLDGDDLAVGAPWRAVGGALHAGAVSFWTRSGGDFTEEGWVVADTPTALDNLGRLLDLDGQRLIAGLPERDEQGLLSGEALLFARGPAGWSQTAVLLPPSGHGGAHAGTAVALDGSRAAVGSVHSDTPLGFASTGAVDVWGQVPEVGP